MSNVNKSSLLELMPEDQRKLLQVPVVLQNRETPLPTYGFKNPPSLDDFARLTGSIWFTNETPILTKEPDEIGNTTLLYLRSNLVPTLSVTLTETDRYFSFHCGSLCCTITGKSDLAIADSAAFLWNSDHTNQPNDIRCWCDQCNFCVLSLAQLDLLFRNQSTAPITLEVTSISPVQSEYIAQATCPVFMTLTESLNSFLDGGHAFVESLLRRDSSFGKLKLWKAHESQNDTFQRLLRTKALDRLELYNPTPQQLEQLCSASAKSIGFFCDADDLLEIDWTSTDIVPKQVFADIEFFDPEDHTIGVCSFLRRLAELGDFVKIEFVLWTNSMPAMVMEELVHAISANQSLIELQIRYQPIQHDDFLQNICATLERHEGLRVFKTNKFSGKADPDFAILKSLLKRNMHLEVFDYEDNRITDGDEIDQLYCFNRFFTGLQTLTQEQLSLLPSLIVEALTRTASGDFRRSAVLTARYTNSLCELVQYSSLLSS